MSLRNRMISLGRSPLARACIVCYALLVAYLSLQPSVGRQLGHMDKLAHFATYLVFALLAVAVTRSTRSRLHACLAIILFSTALEFTQRLVPGRVFSLADLLANALGVGTAMLLTLWLWRPVAALAASEERAREENN